MADQTPYYRYTLLTQRGTIDFEGDIHSGGISSTLEDRGVPDHHPYNVAARMVENLVQWHALAGIDVASAAYIEGINCAFASLAADPVMQSWERSQNRD